ncbi:hypothetical protein [Actinophytocola sp.]|uniref:hypothetical protein n=1 Tax=Actinophytocola sp. TaxID=1872138 RepID=UPI003899E882
MINDFADRASRSSAQATDQLLAIYVVTQAMPDGDRSDQVVGMLLKELESELL